MENERADPTTKASKEAKRLVNNLMDRMFYDVLNLINISKKTSDLHPDDHGDAVTRAEVELLAYFADLESRLGITDDDTEVFDEDRPWIGGVTEDGIEVASGERPPKVYREE